MLADALDAIGSLVSSSLSATLFPLKWQLIRDRLNRLHAGLADITAAGADEENGEGRRDAFVSLLRDVAATAREALELVPRSQGRHYGGGKLRLRSDLDLLAAALDAHVARLDEVFASGALTRARALVVPRPGAGASRDDVRFYVRDLFARLRVGGAEMRREAAAALTEALCDEDKCVRVLVVLLEGRRLLLARPLRHAEQRPWPPAKLSGHRCSRRVTLPQPGPSPPPPSSFHAASGAPLSLPLLSPKCCVTGAVPPLTTGAPLHVAFSSRRRPCARPRTILHAIAFSPRSRTNLTCCHSEHRAESRAASRGTAAMSNARHLFDRKSQRG